MLPPRYAACSTVALMVPTAPVGPVPFSARRVTASGRTLSSTACPTPRSRADRRDAPVTTGESDDGGAALDGFDRPGQEIGGADEVRDEPCPGTLVELLGRPSCSTRPAVHDRDPVAHRERLLLVVGHVHERDPDLVLDALELDLELAPELEVERPERLVEEQHRGPVRRGPARAPPAAAGRPTAGWACASRSPRGGRARGPRRPAALMSALGSLVRLRPNAMLSPTLRCGNSA